MGATEVLGKINANTVVQSSFSGADSQSNGNKFTSERKKKTPSQCRKKKKYYDVYYSDYGLRAFVFQLTT